MTKIYGHVNNTHRRNKIIAMAMMALAVAGMALSVMFMLAPKASGTASGSGGGVGISTYVGWQEAWSDRYQYTGDFQGGNGTPGNPYLIHNAAAMARFAHDINHRDGNGNSAASYKLVANIDLSARRWDPVGRWEYERTFKGTFDGNGYVLSGVTSENQEERNNSRMSGLFGIVDNNAVIKNLKLNNTAINIVRGSGGGWIANGGGLSVGLVAGFVNDGSNVRFENIEINSGRINIPANVSVAGVDAGALLGGTAVSSNPAHIIVNNIKVSNTKVISSASNNNTNSASWRTNNIGGLIGLAIDNVDISKVSINGSDITSANATKYVSVGGLIGRIASTGSATRNVNINDTTITGTRLSSRAQNLNYIGGLVGHIDTGTHVVKINNITIEDGVTITGTASDTTKAEYIVAGGVIGKLDTSKTVDANNIKFEGKISLDGLVEDTKRILLAGGIVGELKYNTVKINKSTVNADINATGGSSKTLGGLVGATFPKVNNGQLEIGDATAIGRIATVSVSTNAFGSAMGAVNDNTSNVKLNNVRTSINGVNNLDLISSKKDAKISNSWQQVLVAPTITQQPAEITKVIKDKDVTLSVKATNISSNANLTYQWYKDGAGAIGGATTETLKLRAGEVGTTKYYVKVSASLLGLQLSTTSNNAQVVVELAQVTPPNITQQPRLFNNSGAMSSNELLLGDIARLEIQANAPNGNLSYQWFEGVGNNTGGRALSGQTKSVLTVPTDASGTKHYYVEVTSTEKDGRKATVASDSVSVIVLNQEAPTITSQPIKELTVIRNTSNILTVSAVSKDNSEISYQWYVTSNPGIDGTMVSGATLPYMMVDTTQVGTSYFYVVVTATIGNNNTTTKSDFSVVKVILPEAAYPEIVAISADEGMLLGQQTNLSVIAKIPDDNSNPGMLKYQWFKNIQPTNAGGQPIQGATADTYTFLAEEEGTFYFYVEVTNVLIADPSIKATTNTDIIEVTVASGLNQQNLSLLSDNLPWIVVIVGSAGVMFAAFVMIVKKSVVEY
jgi:hypothetical protein